MCNVAETSPDPDEARNPEIAARNAEVNACLSAFDARRAEEKDAAERTVRAADERIARTTDPGALADAYADRASAHGTLGNSEQGFRDYAKALELATDRTQVICIKLNNALDLLKDGQRRLSFSWAIDAVNDDVNDAASWDVLGLIAGHCEFYAFAVEALRRAVALEPGHGPAMLRLGQYLREIGNTREAVEVLTRYAAEHPRDPDGWHALGKATQFTLGRADRRERALEHYRRALAENPDVMTRLIIERAIRDIEDADGGAAGEQ